MVEKYGDEESLELLPSRTLDAEARLMLGDVESALGSLRIEDRELLLLVGVEGMEPVEVARILQVDAATIRQRLARARARLLSSLEQLQKSNLSDDQVMP